MGHKESIPGQGDAQERICNSPGEHLLLPGALRSGVSGGTSQCQQRSQAGSQGWAGHLAAAAAAAGVFGFLQPLPRIHHARGSVLSQALMALGDAQV